MAQGTCCAGDGENADSGGDGMHYTPFSFSFLDQAVVYQRIERMSDGGAGKAMKLAKFIFGREKATLRKGAVENLCTQCFVDLHVAG